MRRALPFALVLVAHVAHAEPEPIVVLVIDGPAAEASELADTVTELITRLHVQTARTEPAEGSDVLAHVRVDLRDGAVAHVALEGRHGQRRYERDVPRVGSAAIVRETVAHAIRAGVEAQIFEEERMAEATEPPPPVPVPVPVLVLVPVLSSPPPPPPPRRPWGLDLGAFATGGPIAAHSGVAPRFGLLASVGARTRFAPTLQLSAAYMPPFTTGREPVEATTWTMPLRLASTLTLLRAGRVQLVVGAGIGLDLLHVEPRSDTLPRASLRDATLRVDPMLGAALGVRVALTPLAYLFANAGLDADLRSRAYVIERGPRLEPVLEPWPIRPQLTLGIAFTALGAPAGKAP